LKVLQEAIRNSAGSRISDKGKFLLEDPKNCTFGLTFPTKPTMLRVTSDYRRLRSTGDLPFNIVPETIIIELDVLVTNWFMGGVSLDSSRKNGNLGQDSTGFKLAASSIDSNKASIVALYHLSNEILAKRGTSFNRPFGIPEGQNKKYAARTTYISHRDQSGDFQLGRVGW
jgi:hypothetical protein